MDKLFVFIIICIASTLFPPSGLLLLFLADKYL